MSKIRQPGKVRGLKAAFDKQHQESKRLSEAVRLDLVRGIKTFRNQINLGDVVRALITGKLDNLYNAIPWAKLGGKLAPASDSILLAGQKAALNAERILPKSLGLNYDIRSPQLQEYIGRRTGDLITVVQEGTLQAVRDSTRRAITSGLTPQDVAEEIRGSIGLNARQAQALSNYRNTLSAQGYSDSRIDSLADGYAERLLDQRATMIGRTEVANAINAGQQDVWETARDKGLLPDDAKRVWIVDGDPCPELCLPMSLVTTSLNEPWVLPNKKRVDIPSESHPHCLCIASLDIGGK
ncbi:MAG: hypothetical protein EOP64_00175 [Sphingomonas sp.]|nr:MAG: hypothetical protein EOP64_00175 [Sphingomonas sp.]